MASAVREISLGVAMIDLGFHFLTANPAFLTMFGYSSEELQQLSFLDICIDEAGDECRIPLREDSDYLRRSPAPRSRRRTCHGASRPARGLVCDAVIWWVMSLCSVYEAAGPLPSRGPPMPFVFAEWTDSNVCFPRLTAASTRFGSAVQTKGLGLRFVSATKQLMATCRCRHRRRHCIQHE